MTTRWLVLDIVMDLREVKFANSEHSSKPCFFQDCLRIGNCDGRGDKRIERDFIFCGVFKKWRYGMLDR